MKKRRHKLDTVLSKAEKSLENCKWEPELLLHPQLPKPLSGVNPRTIMGSVWWNKTRKEAYRRKFYHCYACGVYKYNAEFFQWLEGHEAYRINYKKGRAYYERTVALCHACHNFIHQGRLQALLDQGEITQSRFTKIIQHGNRILRAVGLERPDPLEVLVDLSDPSAVAPWHKWRLVFKGKQYKPKFKSLEEWEEFYGVALD